MIKQGQGNYLRVKSVVTRSAQNGTLCESRSVESFELQRIYATAQRQRMILGDYYYVLMLQLAGGARISEVLDIQASDIISRSQVIIRGKKGSENRLVHCPEAAPILTRSLRSGRSPFGHCDRFRAYRLYRRCGIGSGIKFGSKLAVTHALRKLIVQAGRSKGASLETIKQIIGHRSKRSTRHYDITTISRSGGERRR